MFFEILKQKLKNMQTTLCVGLDPHLDLVPDFLKEIIYTKGSYEFLLSFCKSLVDVSYECVSCIKFQSSLFEAFGADGIRALKDSIEYAKHKNLICILDVKRCDIGSSLKGYGEFCFNYLNADAITVIPYMGIGVFDIFLEWIQNTKGIYVVFLSSNVKEAYDIQHSISYIIIEKLNEWLHKNSTNDAIGLVVGAQALEYIEDNLFTKITTYPLLIPGIGFQQGNINHKLKYLINKGDSCNLIPISRSILLSPSLDKSKLSGINNFLMWQQFLKDNINFYKKLF